MLRLKESPTFSESPELAILRARAQKEKAKKRRRTVENWKWWLIVLPLTPILFTVITLAYVGEVVSTWVQERAIKFMDTLDPYVYKDRE